MEQRNLLIAIVLSVGILIGFQFVFERLHPPPAPNVATTATAPASQPGAPGATARRPRRRRPGCGRRASRAESRAAAIAGQPRVQIDTPRLHGSIDLVGARFDDLTLATYHETVNPKSPEVVLLSPSGTANPYFAEFGWVAAHPGTVKVPGPQTLWKAAGGALTPSNPVTLTWDNGEGLIFTRTISDRPQLHVHGATMRCATPASAPVELLPYGLVSRTGTPPGRRLLHPVRRADRLSRRLAAGGQIRLAEPGPARRLSLDRRLARLYRQILADLADPGAERADQGPFHPYAWKTGSTTTRPIFWGQRSPSPPDGTSATSTRFFAGAKEVDLLDPYAASGIPRFDRAIDFGWFYFLTKPIFLILQFFDRLLGNFGLAILLLTLLRQAAVLSRSPTNPTRR